MLVIGLFTAVRIPVRIGLSMRLRRRKRVLPGARFDIVIGMARGGRLECVGPQPVKRRIAVEIERARDETLLR